MPLNTSIRRCWATQLTQSLKPSIKQTETLKWRHCNMSTTRWHSYSEGNRNIQWLHNCKIMTEIPEWQICIEETVNSHLIAFRIQNARLTNRITATEIPDDYYTKASTCNTTVARPFTPVRSKKNACDPSIKFQKYPRDNNAIREQILNCSNTRVIHLIL